LQGRRINQIGESAIGDSFEVGSHKGRRLRRARGMQADGLMDTRPILRLSLSPDRIRKIGDMSAWTARPDLILRHSHPTSKDQASPRLNVSSVGVWQIIIKAQ
jgi:hypothetical protein